MIKWKSSSRFAVALGLGLAICIASRVCAEQPAANDDQRHYGALPGELVVHEWGTFTSFSGSNGVQLDFRPLIEDDLPEFVYDRLLQSGTPTFSKSRIRARVRMETPVTYFYTDRERTVRASVEFPQGLLTEFYPPVVSMLPAPDKLMDEAKTPGNSKLDWGEIDLIPAHVLAPTVKDEKTKKWMQSLVEQRILPHDVANGNHYYSARETDSAFVHIRLNPPKSEPRAPSGDFIEKFLFYRGVGRFDQPLNVSVADDGKITVANTGKQTIRSLFRVTVDGEMITLSTLDQLATGAHVEFPKEERQVNPAELQKMIAEALMKEELYPKEASAMVNTWADSWFTEQGTRIFYMLPREVTDSLLPLTITPTPDKSVRVLVGRVEIMTPTVEKQLLEVVRLQALHRAVLVKRQAELQQQNPIKMPIPVPLVKLGRLAEPALVRIRELAKDESIRREADILLTECRVALDKKGRLGPAISAIPR